MNSAKESHILAAGGREISAVLPPQGRLVLVRMLSAVRLALQKTGLLPIVKRMLYRPSSDNGDRSSQTGWNYRLKLLIEQANFAAVERVHDLPAIHVYWEHKHLAPLFRDFGFETLEDFFSQELAQAARSSPVPTNTVKTTNLIVSIGSGSAMTWCAQQGGIFSECRRH